MNTSTILFLKRTARFSYRIPILAGLICLSASVAGGEDNKIPTFVQGSPRGPDNIIFKYVPGKPILGPGSAFDDALLDKNHVPYQATYGLPDTGRILDGARHSGNPNKEQIINALIKTYPNNKDGSNISPTFLDSIKDALLSIPTEFLSLLAKRGSKICLAPFVTDADPGLAGTHLMGFDDDATFENVTGVFTKGKWVEVSEYKFWREKVLPNPDCKHAVWHEVGHATDRYLGYPSHSFEFVEAYENDRKEMPAAKREALAYYMQEGDRGIKEVFAEMFAYKCSESHSKTRTERAQAFPRCYALVERIYKPYETKF